MVDKIYHPFIGKSIEEKLYEFSGVTGVTVYIPIWSDLSSEIVLYGESAAVTQAAGEITKSYEEMVRTHWKHLYCVLHHRCLYVFLQIKYCW